MIAKNDFDALQGAFAIKNQLNLSICSAGSDFQSLKQGFVEHICSNLTITQNAEEMNPLPMPFVPTPGRNTLR